MDATATERREEGGDPPVQLCSLPEDGRIRSDGMAWDGMEDRIGEVIDVRWQRRLADKVTSSSLGK